MGTGIRTVDKTSSSDAKIALFRSLFRGRTDVYPCRFENRKTGRWGDAPARANELDARLLADTAALPHVADRVERQFPARPIGMRGDLGLG